VFIFSTTLLIIHPWQLEAVVFLHWCLLRALLLLEKNTVYFYLEHKHPILLCLWTVEGTISMENPWFYCYDQYTSLNYKLTTNSDTDTNGAIQWRTFSLRHRGCQMDWNTITRLYFTLDTDTLNSKECTRSRDKTLISLLRTVCMVSKQRNSDTDTNGAAQWRTLSLYHRGC
jgi:hypothetical protein